jgi:peptidoglycan/xylan/chitin deacetylase (PgdA/CDA1 family)
MVILMYHAFGRPGEAPSRFIVPARRFSQQMALIKWLGYRVISLEEFVRLKREGSTPPARSVAITIDDGYADTRSVAYPILRQYGYPATTFLVTDRMGGANDWTAERTIAGREILSWTEASEMQQGKMQFGAHTRTHPRLTLLEPAAAHAEIVGSQVALAGNMGVPARVFAYPYGDLDAGVQAMTSEAGFWGSCGTQSGKNTPETPLFNLRRTEVFGTDTLVAFTRKLRSGERGRVTRASGRRRAQRWSREPLHGRRAGSVTARPPGVNSATERGSS